MKTTVTTPAQIAERVIHIGTESVGLYSPTGGLAIVEEAVGADRARSRGYAARAAVGLAIELGSAPLLDLLDRAAGGLQFCEAILETAIDHAAPGQDVEELAARREELGELVARIVEELVGRGYEPILERFEEAGIDLGQTAEPNR